MLTAPKSTSERRRLKKRADYFFSAPLCARHEVSGFAAELSKLGRAVVIGGLLRDLCLVGARGFNSDVDFVIDAAATADLDRMAKRLGARTNRFGGYEIMLAHWKVDVWPLERTWAAVEGHAAVASVKDLLGVTFFDWDAVLYAVDDQHVIADDRYFDRVRRRVLDINLEPNPNPLGNAVRALRYAERWRARFGRRLALHVAKQIRDHGWDSMVAGERRSFGTSILRSLDGDAVFAALEEQASAVDGCIRLPLGPEQQELPLGNVWRAGGCHAAAWDESAALR